MKEQFIEVVKQLEPELGKFMSITALQEEEYPRHGDSATYIGSTVWVETDTQWVMLYNGPNKYGEYFNASGWSESKIDDIWTCEDLGSNLEELMNDNEITIELLAQEIYEETHMFIEKTIDLENVTEDDVMYVHGKYLTLMAIRNEQQIILKENDEKRTTKTTN